jgi:hypothetical protein
MIFPWNLLLQGIFSSQSCLMTPEGGMIIPLQLQIPVTNSIGSCGVSGAFKDFDFEHRR